MRIRGAMIRGRVNVTPVSSIDKTDHHDLAVKLLKVALNTKTLTYPTFYNYW
jgi:hypothetical protein